MVKGLKNSLSFLLCFRPLQRDAAGNIIKPIASVRPMQSELNNTLATGNRNTKWIPAEVWQRQGMSAQEMTLPLGMVLLCFIKLVF